MQIDEAEFPSPTNPDSNHQLAFPSLLRMVDPFLGMGKQSTQESSQTCRLFLVGGGGLEEEKQDRAALISLAPRARLTTAMGGSTTAWGVDYGRPLCDKNCCWLSLLL